MKKVAIVGGTAGLGRGLAVRLAAGGYDVLIGSRDSGRASEAASEIQAVAGGIVSGDTNEEVLGRVEFAVVTVPYPALASTYKMVKERLPLDSTVLDCNVPLASEVGGKPTRMLGIWEGSAAQQAKSILGKGFHVASGFHTVMAGVLESLGSPLDQDVLVCGDQKAKDAVKEVVGCIQGTRFVDCGPLENARILESLTALLIGINIRHHLEPGAGVRLTGL